MRLLWIDSVGSVLSELGWGSKLRGNEPIYKAYSHQAFVAKNGGKS